MLDAIFSLFSSSLRDNKNSHGTDGKIKTRDFVNNLASQQVCLLKRTSAVEKTMHLVHLIPLHLVRGKQVHTEDLIQMFHKSLH